MKRVFIMLLCTFCLVGCSNFNNEQRILMKARNALPERTNIIYFNSFVDDIVHLMRIEDGEEKYYYYHIESEEYSRNVELLKNKKPVEDITAESALIKQEADLLTALLYEDIQLNEVFKSNTLDFRTGSYIYKIPPEVKQKYRLQDEYEINITTAENQISNIRLVRKEDGNREYFLNILIGPPSIYDML